MSVPLPLHGHCYPGTMSMQGHQHTAVPPSPGWVSVPRTSALLESAAWPHPSSACPACPRLDPGEAPKGGIWKEAKALSTDAPKSSPCPINQPRQHQHMWTNLQMQPAARLAQVPEPTLPLIRVPSHGMAAGVRNTRDLQCPALEPGFGARELPSVAAPAHGTRALARSHWRGGAAQPAPASAAGVSWQGWRQPPGMLMQQIRANRRGKERNITVCSVR